MQQLLSIFIEMRIYNPVKQIILCRFAHIINNIYTK